MTSVDLPASTESRPEKPFDEFIRGLTQPSLPGVIGIVCVAMLLGALCVWGITPHFFASSAAGYLMKNSNDDYVSVSAEVLRLTDSPPVKPTLIAIGDSMMREAISSANELRQDISVTIKSDLDVRIFVASSLTHWQEAAIADCVRNHMHGVVVLEITPFNLAMRRGALSEAMHRRQLALTSDAFDDELRRAGLPVPRRWNNLFMDHYQFFVAREESIFQIMREPVEKDDHPADNLRPWGEKHWQQKWKSVSGWVNTYKQNHVANLEVYERMIDRLRKRGDISVALLEGVQNPQLDERAEGSAEAKKIRGQYRIDVEAFAKRQHVPYWDLREESNLRMEDFVDYAHITNPQARQRYTQCLAKHAAALLESRQLHKELN